VLFLSQHEKAAARAEAKRLRDLPPADLAEEIMPAFGSDGIPPARKLAFGGRGIEILQICDWLMRSHRRGYRQRPGLQKPVIRGLHALEDAALIENTQRWVRVGARLATLRATALGQTAVAERSVRHYLSSPSN
jgi:hypothetical protein